MPLPDDIGDASILQIPSYYVVDSGGAFVESAALTVRDVLLLILSELHALRTLDINNDPL